MATVPDANVHCLAIRGTFDDGQRVLKAQPVGGLVGLGTSPCRIFLPWMRSSAMRGMTSRSACVYGCNGFSNSSS